MEKPENARRARVYIYDATSTSSASPQSFLPLPSHPHWQCLSKSASTGKCFTWESPCFTDNCARYHSVLVRQKWPRSGKRLIDHIHARSYWPYRSPQCIGVQKCKGRRGQRVSGLSVIFIRYCSHFQSPFIDLDYMVWQYNSPQLSQYFVCT